MDRDAKERKLIALMTDDLGLENAGEPELGKIEEEVQVLSDEELDSTLASRLDLPRPTDREALDQALAEIEEPWVLDYIERRQETNQSPVAGLPVWPVRGDRVEELESQLLEERQKIQRLEDKNRHLRTRAQRLEGQLQEIHDSNSWKVARTLSSVRVRVSGKATALLQKVRSVGSDRRDCPGR